MRWTVMAAVFRLPLVRAAAGILGAAYALPAHLPERGIRVLGVLVVRRRHVLTLLLVRRSLLIFATSQRFVYDDPCIDGIQPTRPGPRVSTYAKTSWCQVRSPCCSRSLTGKPVLALKAPALRTGLCRGAAPTS
jgi:hypothetical protein